MYIHQIQYSYTHTYTSVLAIVSIDLHRKCQRSFIKVSDSSHSYKKGGRARAKPLILHPHSDHLYPKTPLPLIHSFIFVYLYFFLIYHEQDLDSCIHNFLRPQNFPTGAMYFFFSSFFFCGLIICITNLVFTFINCFIN